MDVETARNGLLATLNLVAISVVSALSLKVLFLKVQIFNLSYKRQKHHFLNVVVGAGSHLNHINKKYPANDDCRQCG